jgi:glucose-1-phosphate adenylyltransferase
MIYKNVIGLCNLHDSPELGELTSERTLGSTSFLCRYALMDFTLSNFCNSGIDKVGILIKNSPRSVIKHLGSMNAWNMNTKLGSEVIMYNDTGILNPPYNHDIANIRKNDWFLYSKKADYVVIAPAHVVTTMDYRPIIDEHIKNGNEITLVYKRIKDGKEAFRTHNIVTLDEEGYINSFKRNKQDADDIDVSLETYVINKDVLAELVNVHSDQINALYGIKELIINLATRGIYKVKGYEHKGYARCFDSLAHFMEYSFELLDARPSSELFRENWPIYTKTHDSIPALYGPKSNVKNSFVANGAKVFGKVSGSIISRDVVIEEGAVVKNSIILTKTIISKGVTLDHVVIDKYSHISSPVTLTGTKEKPIYFKQGARL